jgi:heavy metal sensor kinase
MKSIRLSLVVYFLALLAAALGVASVLAYQTAQQTLEAKRQATEQLIETQYAERCRGEKAHLDEALLLQAQTLARLVQFHVDWGRLRFRSLHVLGLLSAAPSPGGYVLAPAWAAQGFRGPFSHHYRKKFAEVTQIRLDEEAMLLPVDEQVAEYYQIDSAWGSSYRSPSLGRRSFPFDPAAFAPQEVLHWDFDDITLGPGLRVRRVRLKSPLARLAPFIWPRHPRARHRPPADRDLSGDLPPGPAIYIQCACPVERRDAALQVFRESRDTDLAALDRETAASQDRLRNRLLAMSTITFAAAALGGLWLVRLGLAPLRRLSDAVSRISVRDFRLPLDQPRLPAELRPIGERLSETLGLLKRAFAREQQATADISHELRTPLAALLATTELALRKPRSAEEYRELIQDCRLSAEQMNQAVERLLTLARLDAGVDRLRPRPVDVAGLAEQCAALVRPLAEARGLHLHVVNNCPSSPAGGTAWVTTDPDKLREVITNLLHNAIQYNRPEGAVEVTVAREDGLLKVEVRDTGIGITPEAREHIFERFFRADPARASDSLHAGLGLAIVKEYVDLMGGTVAVDSTEGQGSTFRVRLPVR